jgi:HSP20 family protein
VALTRTGSIDDELERVHHFVSERAYQLFRTNGSSSGPDANWLNAERELLWQPAVEVCQQDGRVEVRAAIAGVDPKDLAVTVTSNDLLIKGNGAHAHRADRRIVHLCEFSGGQLFRPIHFPEPIDPANVTAEYKNGLLTVTASIAGTEMTTTAKKPRSRR